MRAARGGENDAEGQAVAEVAVALRCALGVFEVAVDAARVTRVRGLEEAAARPAARVIDLAAWLGAPGGDPALRRVLVIDDEACHLVIGAHVEVARLPLASAQPLPPLLAPLAARVGLRGLLPAGEGFVLVLELSRLLGLAAGESGEGASRLVAVPAPGG